MRGGIRRGRTERSNQSTLSVLTPPGETGESRLGNELRPAARLLSAAQHPAAAPSRPAFPY